MAMKTIILDSSPSVNLHKPSNISLNISPAYTGQSKKRGQPLLGQRQMHYTHFVPMGQSSQHIKELLAIEDTDNSESKAIEGREDLLKAEKVMKGVEKKSSITPSFDSNYEREAKEYMETPQNSKEDTFPTNDDEESAAGTTAKNDATIATLIASTQPKTPARKPSKPRKKKSAKRPPKKIKKMKKFRIMRKKK